MTPATSSGRHLNGADIIPFPVRRPAEPVAVAPVQTARSGHDRLMAALASLDAALDGQQASMKAWQATLADLDASLAGLDQSLKRFQGNLGRLAGGVSALHTQSVSLQHWADKALASRA